MLKFEKSTAKKRSLIAIVESTQAKKELTRLLKDHGEYDYKIKQTKDVKSEGRALVNGSADIVIIEADAEDPESQAVMRDLCNYISKDGAMIVISSEPSLETVRALFKIGVSDVMPLPLKKEDFYRSLSTAAENRVRRPAPVARNGKVISVVKANGGVGGTTVAVNLARHIMKHESFRTISGGEPRVALFDFNVQFGVAALGLNLKNKANLLTVRKAESRMDEELLYASILKHESGLAVLAAPDEIVPTTAFSIEFMASLISLAKKMFDYIIIDMPLTWTDWTPQVLQSSDAVMPVMMSAVEHVHNMAKLFDGLNRLDIEKDRTLIIVNQLGKGVIYKNRVDQIGQRFKRKLCVRKKDETLHKTASDRGVLLEKAGSVKNAMKEFDAICYELGLILENERVAEESLFGSGDNEPSYLRAN